MAKRFLCYFEALDPEKAFFNILAIFLQIKNATICFINAKHSSEKRKYQLTIEFPAPSP